MDNFKRLIAFVLYRIKMKLTPEPKVISIEETLKHVLKNKSSVSRFGDGELKWIYGIDQDSFQRNDKNLGEQLKKVIKSNQKNCLICVPPIFDGLKLFTNDAAFFWEKNYIRYSNKWRSLLTLKRVYFNANITRPYMEYKNKDNSSKIFSYWKDIFKNRNIIVVEGKYTRFGVQNDFLVTAKNVRRIICPNENAFEKITEIEKSILRNCKGINAPLVLVALGPTATVIAYDLCNKGIQVIDIGHADIEYEWYLRHATHKISIENKFVNEAGDNIKNFGKIDDPIYSSQIIDEII